MVCVAQAGELPCHPCTEPITGWVPSHSPHCPLHQEPPFFWVLSLHDSANPCCLQLNQHDLPPQNKQHRCSGCGVCKWGLAQSPRVHLPAALWQLSFAPPSRRATPHPG